MNPTRRELIAGMAAAALRAAQPAPRPMVCLHSQILIKLEYTELGGIVKQLGFEGIDLTIREGGHVLPRMAPVDVVRAIESLRGEDLEVPMITTGFHSAMDPWARNVLGLAGPMEVKLFAPGLYPYGNGASVEARLGEVRRDFAGLVALGRAYGMAAGFPNPGGLEVGEAVWDIREILAPLDPRWAGYYFDPGYATANGGAGGWKIALRLALPRLKMVSLRDFVWEKKGTGWRMRLCPLGEGMVEWPEVFRMLAEARFTGPLSLHIDYNPADELAAIRHDLSFVNRHMDAAWPAPAAAGTSL